MTKAISKRFVLIALGVFIGGCSLAPSYQRPEAPIAASWTSANSAEFEAVAADQLAWQSFIADEQLRQLIEAALKQNRSLRQSLLAIEQARAQYRIERADRVPSIGAAANASRQRQSEHLSTAGRSEVLSSYQVGLSVPEYELDLFGRVRNLSEAALQEYLATEEAGRAARLALIAEVSQAYLTWQTANRQLALTEQTLASREDSQKLIAQRRAAGIANALDDQEARSLVEQARADLLSYQRAQQQAYNALVLLVANEQGALDLNAERPLAPLQNVSAGLPSELLERRPDILASEHRLRARNADIGAARAVFFPRISLTGFAGSASNELSGLFESGTRVWSFTPSLYLPIFSGGRNSAALDLATVRRDSAVAEYEQRIQSAFREVADALAAITTLEEELKARQALVASSRESLFLAKARYQAGVDSHLRYLEAQRESFAVEQALVDAELRQQIAKVDLFRALGGGWAQ